MADIGKVTPGAPVIPAMPQEKPVDEHGHAEQEKRRRDKRQEGEPQPDSDSNGMDGEGGIDVYV